MRTKQPDQSKGSNYQRSLTRLTLTLYGIGNTIGAGIFALIGVAVKYSGPSLCFSFALAGLLCLSTAFTFAELMARYPSNGSAFSFMYASFGELMAWLTGWLLLPRYGAVSAALSRAMTSYLNGVISFIGL